MSIQVHFFASLAERLDKSRAVVDAGDASTALEVWQKATGHSELAENILVAINQEYARGNDAVADGDEVAFFPPVTGG